MSCPDLPPDAYEIATKDQFLFLRGGPGRGVVNAVYALLEEDFKAPSIVRADLKVRILEITVCEDNSEAVNDRGLLRRRLVAG